MTPNTTDGATHGGPQGGAGGAPDGEVRRDRDAIITLAALRGIHPDGAPVRSEKYLKGYRLTSGGPSTDQGFAAGRTPEAVASMVHAWYGRRRGIVGAIWHPILWDLTHEFLLPAMREAGLRTEVEFRDEPLAARNPVRFTDATGYNDPSLDQLARPRVVVHVPWLEVLARVVLVMGLDPDPSMDEPD